MKIVPCSKFHTHFATSYNLFFFFFFKFLSKSLIPDLIDSNPEDFGKSIENAAPVVLHLDVVDLRGEFRSATAAEKIIKENIKLSRILAFH